MLKSASKPKLRELTSQQNVEMTGNKHQIDLLQNPTRFYPKQSKLPKKTRFVIKTWFVNLDEITDDYPNRTENNGCERILLLRWLLPFLFAY